MMGVTVITFHSDPNRFWKTGDFEDEDELMAMALVAKKR